MSAVIASIFAGLGAGFIIGMNLAYARECYRNRTPVDVALTRIGGALLGFGIFIAIRLVP